MISKFRSLHKSNLIDIFSKMIATTPLAKNIKPVDLKEELSQSTQANLISKFDLSSAKTRTKKKKVSPLDSELENSFLHENRKDFDYVYEKIKEMRKNKNAPVDTSGCDTCADPTASKEERDFQILVALLLSVQNRDESTALAVEKFIKHGLTLEKVYQMTEEEIRQIVSNVNFNRKKARHIKQATSLIIEKYGGEIPDKLNELLAFPGIGYKIAILYLNSAHALNVGIGVDTHVHRISNRLGWVNTKLPDKTRLELESFIPKSHWTEINHYLVGFGQQICLPISPKCQSCLLSDRCPFVQKNLAQIKNEK